MLSGLLVSGCFLAIATALRADLPTIVIPPQPQTVLAGSSATFTVEVTGDSPLTYRWRRNGAVVSGVTNTLELTNTLVLANVQASAVIMVVISNASGSVTSAPVSLTVTSAPTPPSITAQPASLTVNAGAPASFTVGASGSATLKYQWRFNGDIVSATTATFARAHVYETNAGNYDVVVTNDFGSVTSAVATLIVNPGPPGSTGNPPVIVTPPQPQTVLAGATVTFTVVAQSDSPLSYSWRRDGSNIWGAPNGDTFTLPNVRVSAAISVLVSNAGGSVLAGPAALTVNSPPLITSQPSSVTVLPGGQASFNVMVSGDAPLNYQWRFNGVDITDATGPNFVIASAQTNDVGNYSVRIRNAFGAVTSAVAVLTVDPTAYLHWAWARKMGGPGEQWPRYIALGPAGEVYVAGRFAFATDFGGQTLSTPAYDQRDVFVARYDQSGGLVWVRRAGDGAPHLSADAAGVAVDSSGNVFVAGTVQSRTTFQNSRFLNKFDANGSNLWTKVLTSASYNNVSGLAVDAGGNAYIVGKLVSLGYLAKYNSDGTVGWNRSLAPQFIDDIRGMTVDSQTNIFVTGDFANALNFGTGMIYPSSGFDAFLAKFNGAGSNLWARRVDGSEDGRAVATDAAGNCYLTGSGVGLAKFDSLGDLLWKSPIGGYGAFALAVDNAGGVFVGEESITKYNDSGVPIWTANITSTGPIGIWGLALQGCSNLFAAGQFGYGTNNTINFDSITLTQEGSGDGFVAKLTGIDLISPPVVTNPPVVSAVTPGSGLTLHVQAGGGGQMTYQWRLNGVDIPGATSSTLNLPGLSLDAAGLYSVVARNALGASTNVAADLSLWSLQVTGSVAAFSIAGTAGAEYVIECASALSSVWTPVTNVTLLDGSARLLNSDPVYAPARFYRLKRISP